MHIRVPQNQHKMHNTGKHTSTIRILQPEQQQYSSGYKIRTTSVLRKKNIDQINLHA